MKERISIKVQKMAKERIVWGFSPVTRVKKNKKKYERAMQKRAHYAVE